MRRAGFRDDAGGGRDGVLEALLFGARVLEQGTQAVFHRGLGGCAELLVHPGDVGKRVFDIALSSRFVADFGACTGNL